MSMNKKISIILPAFEAEKTNRNCHRISIKTYRNLELIVIENGIKNHTEEIVKSLNKDNKIIYIYTEQPNVSLARNIGIQNATGDYITFLDADDKYENNFLEKMVKKIEEGYELVACGYKLDKSNKKVVLKKKYNLKESDLKTYLETLKSHDLFNEIWNKIYLSNIIKKQNLRFDEALNLGEDFIFNLSYLFYINKAGYINEDLYIYNDGQNGLKLKYREDRFRIEYNLTKNLEEFYNAKGYSKEYIYNRIAWTYYRGVVNIYNKNNKISRQEKNEKLEDFINSNQYKNDLIEIHNKLTDKRFIFVVNHILLKDKFRIKVFIFLNKIRNIFKGV